MASEQFSLCWDNFHKNMSSGMNSLLESEDLVDVTLAVEGKFLKAHKMVLSVCSPYFKDLFKSMNPYQHPVVFMKDVSYVAISDLLQFMYQGEVQVSQENLTTFIKTAEALQIKGLTGDGNGSLEGENDLPTRNSTTSEPQITQMPRPKVQRPAPAPVVSSTPVTKKPRLSQSSEPAATLVPTKQEPVAPVQQEAAAPPVHFKMEPYDQNQSVTIPDDDEQDTEQGFDDTHDDTEDYSMMEGDEPQAGTSTDGAGEGQAVLMSNQLKGRQKQIRRSPRKLVKTEDNVYKKYLAKTRYGLKFQKESERRKRDILQTSPRQRKEAPAVIKQKTFETKIQQLCKEYNDKETNIKQEKTPDKPAEDIEQNKHVTVKTKRLVNAETYYEIYKMQNKERRKHLAILRDQQQRTELDRKRTMKANKTNLKNPRNIIMNKKSKLKQVTLKQATNKRKVISTEKELKNTSNKLNQKIMVKNPSNVKKEKTTDPHENLQEKGKVIIRRVKTKQDLFGKTKLLDLEKRKIVSPGTRKTGLKKVSNLKKELPEEHFETESTLKKDMTWNIKKVENVKLDADSISLTNQVKTFKEESAKSVGVNTTETITIIITPNSEDSHKDKNVSTNNENFKGFKTANPDLGKSTIKSIKVASTLTNENETANKNEKLNENLLVNPVIEKNSETINKEDSNSTNSEASHKNKTAPVKKSENLQAVEKVLAENSITGRSENIEVQEPPVPLLDVLMIKCESDDEFFE